MKVIHHDTGETVEVERAFYWGSCLAVVLAGEEYKYGPGYILLDTSDREVVMENGEPIPTLTDEEVVERFLEEDGHCYSGDDDFNLAVERMAKLLGKGPKGFEEMD